VNGDTGVSIIAMGGEVIYGNGITMGDGYYGPNTIFMGRIAAGDSTQPEYNPAEIVAINRETGEQHILSGQDPYLSLPSFLSIFHTSGGTGYARAGLLDSPVHSMSDSKASSADRMREGTLLFSAIVTVRHNVPLADAQPTTGSIRLSGWHPRTGKQTASDSFFGRWESSLTTVCIPRAKVFEDAD
jgi:hypothetical protein